MGERKEEDLYRNFSRKDLQSLCKKYGLPANKSNSEMATSLILYLEKKNLSTRAIWEGTRSDLFASGTTELQTFVSMNSTDDQRKDCGRMASHRGSGNNQRHNHRDAQPNHLQNFKDSATSDKASVDVNNLTQHHSESISGAVVPKNIFSSVVSSPVVASVPTFTFDVCCEEGIQLYVDLNSSPSDWIESLKSGVHIDHVVQPKSQSFHEDIGLLSCPKQQNGSVSIDPSKETDHGQLQDGSYPTPTLTDNLAQTDEADEGEGSLSSPGLKSLSNAVHSLGNLIDKQGCLTSRLDSGTEGQLPGAKSSRREDIFSVDSDLNAAVQTRNHLNFTGNSVPSDPKCSGMPAHQGSNAGNGICNNSPLLQTYCSLDPVATMSQDIEYSPNGIGRCEDVVDRLKNNEVGLSGIVKSIQVPSRDELQMWPVQAVDQSTFVSPVLNSLPLDLADNRSKVQTEHSRTSFFRKSDKQIRETQSHSAGHHSKGRCFSSCHRYESQNVIDLTNAIETENAGFLRTPEAGIEINELQHKDAALYPCCNDGSLELIVPRQNGVNHCISTKSNELQEDICRSPDTANVGNLGKSDTGNGREGSECLNFDDLTERPWKKSSDPESTGEHKRKKIFNSVEHQSKFVHTEAKILRSSKQFDGDGNSKRRRSSRLFTK